MTPTLWQVAAVLAPALAFGQATNTTGNATVVPQCLQPRQQTHPNGTELVGFLQPLLNAACVFLGAANTTDVVTSALFNQTGYGFAKVNVDTAPANMTECHTAFSSIISTCIVGSSSFGGQWAASIELSYILTSLVYPSNPLNTSAANLLSTPASGSNDNTTFPQHTVSQPAVPSITLAPVGPGDTQLTDLVNDIKHQLEIAIAAAALLLGFSVAGPLISEPFALAAEAAVEDLATTAIVSLAIFPQTDAVLTLLDSIEVARFAAIVNQRLPNPVTSVILGSALAATLVAVGPVAEEAEEEETATTKAATSTTTSSATNGPTPYVVLFNEKWPDVLLDVVADAFPDDGEGEMEHLSGLGIKAYVTDMREGLADALAILPIFADIFDNLPIEDVDTAGSGDDSDDDSDDDSEDSDDGDENLDRRSSDPDPDAGSGPGPGLEGRSFSPLARRQFPLIERANIDQQLPDLTPFGGDQIPHLTFISKGDGANVPTFGAGNSYLFPATKGTGTRVYVADNGWGGPGALAPGQALPEEFQTTTIEYTTLPKYDKVMKCKIGFTAPAAAADRIVDEDGHGTCVSDVAVGYHNGVAKGADLFVLKLDYDNACVVRPNGLLLAADAVIGNIVRDKMFGKAVVVWVSSFSTTNLKKLASYDTAFIRAFTAIMDAGAVIVVAAGQLAAEQKIKNIPTDLNYHSPQRLAYLTRDKFPIILVGGLQLDGTISHDHCTESVGRTPAISVWASYLAYCTNPSFTILKNQVQGTSISAPAVAGVISTWLSDPDIKRAIQGTATSLPNLSPGRVFAAQVRNFLIAQALTRDLNPEVLSVYNGMTENFCRLPTASANNNARRDDIIEDPWVAVGDAPGPSDPDMIISHVVVNGTIVDPSFAPTSCSLPPTCNPLISCDDCAGTYQPASNVALCTTGTPSGCQCVPTAQTCGAPLSCDLNGCAGAFVGLAIAPTCQTNFKGCVCTPTSNTCGASQSCSLNGCAGQYIPNTNTATCRGNFNGCPCTPTGNTCSLPQSCDLNGCAGAFSGLTVSPACTKNTAGCPCFATATTCGKSQSCDLNGCAGGFNSAGVAQCRGNFVGCNCTSTAKTCGTPLSCDLNGCAGAFPGSVAQPVCTAKFVGCQCIATSQTCGKAQSCDGNGCAGTFLPLSNIAQCSNNFVGCNCTATSTTCGLPLACELNGCAGISDSTGIAKCQANFAGCNCLPSTVTPGFSCGQAQSCEMNNCAGTVDTDGSVMCKKAFAGCTCIPSAATPGFNCGSPQSCELNHCDGTIEKNNGFAVCRNAFAGCKCTPSTVTPGFQCGTPQACNVNGCDGTIVTGQLNGAATCKNNFAGCVCLPASVTPGFSCGNALNCQLGGCAGTVNGDGSSTCKKNFAGCPCLPGAQTPGFSCGTPQPCGNNGCAGTVVGGVAACRGNFAGCLCIAATSSTPSYQCGTAQGCSLNGCAGTDTGNGPVCRGNFAGCPCLSDQATVGQCSQTLQCSDPRCVGLNVGLALGGCTLAGQIGCPCTFGNTGEVVTGGNGKPSTPSLPWTISLGSMEYGYLCSPLGGRVPVVDPQVCTKATSAWAWIQNSPYTPTKNAPTGMGNPCVNTAQNPFTLGGISGLTIGGCGGPLFITLNGQKVQTCTPSSFEFGEVKYLLSNGAAEYFVATQGYICS